MGEQTLTWDGPTFQTYYHQIDRLIASRLGQESPDTLIAVDFEEYLNYLVSEAEWVPLEWDESQMTVEPFTTKVTRPHAWEAGRTYTADEQRFRLRIPTTGHPHLHDFLKFQPSSQLLTAEPEWKFSGNVLVIEVEPTEAAVREAVESVRFWIGGRNRDIAIGNPRLRELIRPVWERRRKQLEEQHGAAQAVLKKLNIPLDQAADAKAKPIEIKPRVLRAVVAKPTPRARTEPALVHDDVLGLVKFIDDYARQFEVTPRTYANMDEEELRGLIVGMMNANYPGSTTAETFSKLGKTDIRFRVDDGNVLIAECKVWQGAAAYTAALEQLFRYLTWRENYGVLIVFSRRKDMTAAITEAKKAAQGHASFTAGRLAAQSASRFSTRHLHPQDQNKSVEVFTLFVDLSA